MTPAQATRMAGDLSLLSDASLWRIRGAAVTIDRPVVMGILNLTPDSFSDGGAYPTLTSAVARAVEMVEEGADLIDVGGESTRPGAAPVPVEDEVRRVVPVLRALSSEIDVPISIDTRRAAVAQAAVEAGAAIVNDVSALSHDGEMGGVVADSAAGVILMHMRGTPATMGDFAEYDDVLREVRVELAAAMQRADRAGIPREAVVIDPGIGFAKDAGHNLRLLGSMEDLCTLGRPVMVGPSRKRYLGEILGLPPGERVEGTIASCVRAHIGGARLFRVHDVGPVRRALDVAHAIPAAGESGA